MLAGAELAWGSYERRAAAWRHSFTQPHPICVALEGERVIGLADGGANRTLVMPFDGELYAIYIDFAEHRRGIGRALVAALARTLAAAGYQSLCVWALRDNPAGRFYERLGGTL